jgi:microcystin-dependent protein
MASDQPYISSVELWPLNWAPMNWAPCNGQLLAITQYTALFSLLGTTYGGNGQTNFALPDLRGRVPVGMGQSPGTSNYNIGQSGGAEVVSLTVNQMPQHTHTATGTVNPAAATGGRGSSTSVDPTSNFPGTAPATAPVYGTPATAQMGQSPVTVTVQQAGGGQPFGILQPYLALNYIIALQGLYPSRP